MVRSSPLRPLSSTPSQPPSPISSIPKQSENFYSGPYTEAQVHELEAFAMNLLRVNIPAKKNVIPWLRKKLGPYYKDSWQQRVIAREAAARKDERVAKRPAESSHFTVSHPPKEESLQAGDESPFAIIGLAGTQYKVSQGDVVICNKLPGAEVGTKIELMDVLLIGFKSKTLIGRPNVPNYVVTAMVEQQAKEKKQYAFYKKPKTFSQKMRGFRREVTILRIAEILEKKEANQSTTTEPTKS